MVDGDGIKTILACRDAKGLLTSEVTPDPFKQLFVGCLNCRCHNCEFWNVKYFYFWVKPIFPFAVPNIVTFNKKFKLRANFFIFINKKRHPKTSILQD